MCKKSFGTQYKIQITWPAIHWKHRMKWTEILEILTEIPNNPFGFKTKAVGLVISYMPKG